LVGVILSASLLLRLNKNESNEALEKKSFYRIEVKRTLVELEKKLLQNSSV
jgi:hypothetical protein